MNAPVFDDIIVRDEREALLLRLLQHGAIRCKTIQNRPKQISFVRQFTREFPP